MSLNTEGEMLLIKVKQLRDIRKARDEDASNARAAQEAAEREFTIWKLREHNIEKGTILEWDRQSYGIVRAIVESWSVLTADSGRYNHNSQKWENTLEDPDELPTIYVRIALKSGGWSARTYSIWDPKQITQVY